MAEVPILSQSSSFGIYFVESDAGMGVSPSISIFPCIIPPKLHTHSFIYQQRYMILATDNTFN
jgi:hypothetical protein